jgi:hypothetical protein
VNAGPDSVSLGHISWTVGKALTIPKVGPRTAALRHVHREGVPFAGLREAFSSPVRHRVVGDVAIRRRKRALAGDGLRGHPPGDRPSGVHAVIRRALVQAQRWGWIQGNPAALASPARSDGSVALAVVAPRGAGR